MPVASHEGGGGTEMRIPCPPDVLSHDIKPEDSPPRHRLRITFRIEGRQSEAGDVAKVVGETCCCFSRNTRLGSSNHRPRLTASIPGQPPKVEVV